MPKLLYYMTHTGQNLTFLMTANSYKSQLKYGTMIVDGPQMTSMMLAVLQALIQTLLSTRNSLVLGGTVTETSDGAADGSLQGPQAKIIVEISVVNVK